MPENSVQQQNAKENWRAGYLETGTSGSEGSSVKPDTETCQGARFLPYGLVSGFEVELGYVRRATA